MRYVRERNEIVAVCRRLYERHLISGPEGNVSVRVDESVLTTPSGRCKGYLSAADVVLVDLQGRVIEGQERATSELPMHLAIYDARPDVRAVVHAHPPSVLAISLSREPLPERALAESIVLLGPVPRVPFELPGSRELGHKVAAALGPSSTVAILENHGAVAVGRTLEEAWMRMETLAAVCQAIWMARLLGKVHELPDDAVARLLDRQGDTP